MQEFSPWSKWTYLPPGQIERRSSSPLTSPPWRTYFTSGDSADRSRGPAAERANHGWGGERACRVALRNPLDSTRAGANDPLLQNLFTRSPATEVFHATSFCGSARVSRERRDPGSLVVSTRQRCPRGARHAESVVEPLLSRTGAAVRVWYGPGTARSRRAGRGGDFHRAGSTRGNRAGRSHWIAFLQSWRTRRIGRRLPARLRAVHSAAAAGSLRSHRLRPARHSTKHGGALLREPPSMGRLPDALPVPRHRRR